MTQRPALRALAERAGVLAEYLNYNATQVHVTPEATCQAILKSLGYEADDETAAAATLESLEAAESSRLIDPVSVRAEGSKEPVRLRWPGGVLPDATWELSLTLEDGSMHSARGLVDAIAEQVVHVALPVDPPTGYHRLWIAVQSGGSLTQAVQKLIVTPTRCAEWTLRGSRRQWRGLWTNLYSIRSRRNWGIGDFGDARTLIEWAGEAGLAFVAVNPIHALRNRGDDVSPYRPVSRLYRNELYLDIEAVPEWEVSQEAARITDDPSFKASLDLLRSALIIDYDAVHFMKRRVLRTLHEEFIARHAHGQSGRGRAYREFVERQGRPLLDFATFVVLDEYFRHQDPQRFPCWGQWPGAFRDRDSKEVAAFRDEHRRDVDFHLYVQFEIDRQLQSLAWLAREKGLKIGLMGDLAIGTAPDGCDSWAFPGLFVEDVSIGAPPDDLGPAGQNWDIRPIHPEALQQTGYDYWILLLRNALAHHGALRMDHVMGLLRQFWIPRGMDGTRGAYVRFPAEPMFSILALESRRASAIIVGEDLGTVPAGFRDLLRRFGVLSTKVVYFERDYSGAFLPAAAYEPCSFVVAGTHDMAPLAGFVQGADLMLRRKVGDIASDEHLQSALDGRRQTTEALLARLKEEGALSGSAQEPWTLGAAMARFLAKTPACMAAVSLDDLAGELEPVNLPGVGQNRHHNWSRRMSRWLEELTRSTDIRTLLALDAV